MREVFNLPSDATWEEHPPDLPQAPTLGFRTPDFLLTLLLTRGKLLGSTLRGGRGSGERLCQDSLLDVEEVWLRRCRWVDHPDHEPDRGISRDALLAVMGPGMGWP